MRYLVRIKPKRRNWKIPPGANLMAIKLGTVTSNCPQSRKISGTHRFHVRSTRGTERFLVRYISLAEPSLQLVWIGGAIVWEAIGTSRRSQTGKLDGRAELNRTKAWMFEIVWGNQSLHIWDNFGSHWTSRKTQTGKLDGCTGRTG